MTQEKAADYLQIDVRQYRRYELGKREILVHHLRRLAQLYNTSEDYILELTDDPKPYKRI